MNTVKVQYTVKKEHVEKNKQNIHNVIKELKELNQNNVIYTAYLLDDGKTFMHIASAEEGSPGDVIGNLSAFKKFREELQGNAESPPHQSEITLIDTSL